MLPIESVREIAGAVEQSQGAGAVTVDVDALIVKSGGKRYPFTAAVSRLKRAYLPVPRPHHHRQCGRVCMAPHKITLSTVFAGQKVGVKQVADQVWLVSFMDYDLGFLDEETTRLEPIANPFEAKVLPMCPE